MYQIGIWEREEEISRTVSRALEGAGYEAVCLHRGRHPAELAGLPLDLLVIAPGALGLAGAGAVTCRTVLLPGGAGPLVRHLKTGSAVSYGMSPRDTITVSSLEEGRLCLALQREVVTLAGDVIDRQELILPLSGGAEPLPCLAAAGTQLLLGLVPVLD